jgi:hypothetical protein
MLEFSLRMHARVVGKTTMGRKGKRFGGDERRPPKLDDPEARAKAEAEEDQIFQAAMANMGKVPVKDRTPEPQRLGAGPAKAARGGDVLKVDLHRLTLDEAQERIDAVLEGVIADLKPGDRVKVQIITGKGRHSEGGGVLAREAPRYVKRRFKDFIVAIEDAPADLVVGELPIRGHFHVTLGRR